MSTLDPDERRDVEDALEAIRGFAVCLMALSESQDIEETTAIVTGRLAKEVLLRAESIGQRLNIGNPTFIPKVSEPLPDNVVPLPR